MNKQKIISEKEFNKLAKMAAYRTPMKITEIRITHNFYSGNIGYYLCPRCKMELERDFMGYCNCCGQKLDWRGYRKAKRIYPNGKK